MYNNSVYKFVIYLFRLISIIWKIIYNKDYKMVYRKYIRGEIYEMFFFVVSF